MGMIELPVKENGGGPKQQHKDESDPRGGGHGEQLPGGADREAARDGREGVYVGAEHERHPLGHHVPDDAAADGGDKSEHDGHDVLFLRMGVQAGERTGDGEGSEAARIRNGVEHGDPLFAAPGNGNEFVEKRYGEGRCDGKEQSRRAAEGGRRCDACEDVADHAAADAGHDGENGDAEYVHAPGQAGHGAGKGKGDGAHGFKYQPGDGHSSLSFHC